MRPFTRGQLAGLRLIRQAEAEAARVVREREAAAVPMETCVECGGRKFVLGEMGGVPCPACEGTGLLPEGSRIPTPGEVAAAAGMNPDGSCARCDDAGCTSCMPIVPNAARTDASR